MASSFSSMYWIPTTLGVMCLAGLITGFNMTLGTRWRVGLPLIVVCAGVLVALGVTAVLVLIQ